MNGPLKEAAVTDPKWARKEQRREWLLKAVTAGVIIALTVGVLTIFQNRGQDAAITNVTRIQKTPCNRDPAGKACARLRQAVAKAEPIENPCTSYQRVTGRRGKNCPRFYVRPEQQGPSFNSGASAATSGSKASKPASSGGGGASEPGGGSVQGGVGKGGGKSPGPKDGTPAAPAASSPTSTAPTGDGPGNSSPSSNPPASSKPNPVAEGVGSTVEGVGDVVQEAGETVNGAVEGITGKACGLLGASC
jgi:hypothetical protein